MKTCHLSFLLAATTVSMLQAEDLKGLIYEENFNLVHNRIDYRNGAVLGGPGTGVSGKPGDRAYIGLPKSTEQEKNGPVGIVKSPIAPDSLSAFTCTFWYYLDEQGPELQVPLSTAGVMFLLHDKGFEIRIECSPEQPRSYVFVPGLDGPHHGWRDRNRWIFAAFSWRQTTNTLAVHQGTLHGAVAFMRTMNRATPANPTLPRTDLVSIPETIGNTFRTHERPMAGRMDNLRFYDRELGCDDLERIRLADLANMPVKLK